METESNQEKNKRRNKLERAYSENKLSAKEYEMWREVYTSEPTTDFNRPTPTTPYGKRRKRRAD